METAAKSPTTSVGYGFVAVVQLYACSALMVVTASLSRGLPSPTAQRKQERTAGSQARTRAEADAKAAREAAHLPAPVVAATAAVEVVEGEEEEEEEVEEIE